MFDSTLARHRKDPVNFASFISDTYCRADLFCGLRHRFAKERYNFTINDLVQTEPTNALAKSIGDDTIRKQVEWARNMVGVDLLVSLIGVRPIFQTIHRVSEMTQFGVSDCEFDFL